VCLFKGFGNSGKLRVESQCIVGSGIPMCRISIGSRKIMKLKQVRGETQK